MRIFFSSLFCFTLAVPVFSAPPELHRYEFAQVHMGTRFRIVLYAAQKDAATRATASAFRRISHLDHTMSDYRPTSELMCLCAKSGTGPIKVSEELFYVLERSQNLARRTEGAFDVTVGPAVKLWREARRERNLPDAKLLTEAMARVGYRHMQLDAKTRTVHLLQEGMSLDLGGIAKGYAADEALRVLKSHGIERALVDAGGDVVVGKAPPGNLGWKIGVAPLGAIQLPEFQSESQSSARTIMLENASVSTSGDAEQFLEIDGKRYSHVLDPRTGVGVLGPRGVTVIASSGTLSDALATAVSVLGRREGRALIESFEDTSALYVQASEAGGSIQGFNWNFPASTSLSGNQLFCPPGAAALALSKISRIPPSELRMPLASNGRKIFVACPPEIFTSDSKYFRAIR